MNINEIKKILPEFAKYIVYISAGLFGLQCLIFIISFITKISFIFLTILLGSLAIFLFTVLKEYSSDEKQKRTAFIFFELSIIVFLCGGINDLIWLIFGDMGGIASLLPLLADSLIFLFLLAFAKSPEGTLKETLELYYNSDFKSFKENKNKEITYKPGTAILGTDIETHKPVYLPLKDRYLHMLILGPTGSGKTSQTIIPMIYRDIQLTGDDKLGIIVIEPKGDLAEKIYAMGKMFNRKIQYFNPMLNDCPYFNPLMGEESDVIENFVTSFNAFDADSSTFFRDSNEVLLRRGLTVVYRLVRDNYLKGLSQKEYPTLLDLDTLLYNTQDKGKDIVSAFKQIAVEDSRTLKEHNDIAAWFQDEYFQTQQGRPSKAYENTSGVRTTLTKIISNKYLREVLCPPDVMSDEDKKRGFINFSSCLANKEVLTISSAQGDLQDLGKFLGYFLILNLQSAVFSRPGNENTRPGCMLYIDEFQTYANPQFQNMLTQGRSYRVASHLATQNRALIGMNSGKNAKSFTDLVDTNCRNLILYPGGNPDDAKYYSAKFGEELFIDKQVSVSRQQFNPLYGFMMRAPSTTEREVETSKARFSPSDIIYKDFGEIIYSIIQNNTLQKPGISKIEYIPKEVNDKLDKMVEEYNKKALTTSTNKHSTSLFELEKADDSFKKKNMETYDSGTTISINNSLIDEADDLGEGEGIESIPEEDAEELLNDISQELKFDFTEEFENEFEDEIEEDFLE